MGGCEDITVKCSMRLMRMAVLKISNIRDVEVHRICCAMLSPADRHVCLMYLWTSVGAVLPKVARMLAFVANAGKRMNAATITGSPATSTPIAAASVVNLLRRISASIVEWRRAVVAVAKTGWTLKSVEKKLPFGGSNVAAISELMAEATRPTLVFPRVVATSRDAGVVDLVAVVAGVIRGITSPAINHNKLKSCGHGHLHGAAFGFFRPLFLLGIPKVRSNVVNCPLASPP